jgi:hypothetical protein
MATCYYVRRREDRDEALFDGWRGSLAAELLDVGRDVQRHHLGDRRYAGALAPGQEFSPRPRVGAAPTMTSFGQSTTGSTPGPRA